MPGFELPEGFRFGVATAGFQVEGGYNGPGEPANNWLAWEVEGRVEPSGAALDFWHRFEHHLDKATAAGCDAFRLSVEWARVEPNEGEIDSTALDRYATILDACHERSLQPLVSLHHFTHPAWLGVDFWLRPDSPERFATWVATAVDRLAGRCRHWVTLNEINIYALQSYMLGMFPPGRRLDVAATVRTMDHMLAAHVVAYDVIKARQPQAVVATNNYSFSIYELDRLLTDVLLARSHGIGRYDLGPWLEARQGDYHRAAQPSAAAIERAVRRIARSTVPLDQALPRAIAAVYASDHSRTLDVTQIDYYDPLVARHLRMPGHRTAGGRNWLPARLLWDDPPHPRDLTRYCELNTEPGIAVWVVENGLCNRVRRGRSFPRSDGWDRPRYLKENIGAVVRGIEGGIPIGSYYHWTLADNYEWGSYEPRFGLYGIDRERGCRWSANDSMGADSAGTYRRIIERLREGDTSLVR